MNVFFNGKTALRIFCLLQLIIQTKPDEWLPEQDVKISLKDKTLVPESVNPPD